MSDFLGLDQDKIFSIVMFWGECQFKAPMPANVMDRGYTGYIKSKTEVIFSEDEVAEIVAAIKTGMLPKSLKMRREHIQTLNQLFSIATVCPKCGAALVLRTAKTGRTAGNQFYGCSGFPKCRYVRTMR